MGRGSPRPDSPLVDGFGATRMTTYTRVERRGFTLPVLLQRVVIPAKSETNKGRVVHFEVVEPNLQEPAINETTYWRHPSTSVLNY